MLRQMMEQGASGRTQMTEQGQTDRTRIAGDNSLAQQLAQNQGFFDTTQLQTQAQILERMLSEGGADRRAGQQFFAPNNQSVSMYGNQFGGGQGGQPGAGQPGAARAGGGGLAERTLAMQEELNKANTAKIRDDDLNRRREKARAALSGLYTNDPDGVRVNKLLAAMGEDAWGATGDELYDKAMPHIGNTLTGQFDSGPQDEILRFWRDDAAGMGKIPTNTLPYEVAGQGSDWAFWNDANEGDFRFQSPDGLVAVSAGQLSADGQTRLKQQIAKQRRLRDAAQGGTGRGGYEIP